MSSRRTLSTLYYLPVLLGVFLWQAGCGSGTSPTDVITAGDTTLPTLILTCLTDTSDGPALVGLGGTYTLTWELLNPPTDAIVKLYLDNDGEIKSDGQSYLISPESGVTATNKTYDFTPTKDTVPTGKDYYLVAQLHAGGYLFDTRVSLQKMRVGDGGVIVTSQTVARSLARGLPVDVTWNLTNNICEDLKDKAKFVKLYLDTVPYFRAGQSIEVTPEDGVDGCDGAYTIQTGEVNGLSLNVPYYVIARLYIDGLDTENEVSRSASKSTITALTSLNITAPDKDVTSNLQAIPVSWEVVGRPTTNLKVEILAKIYPEVANDPDRIISQEYSADQGSGPADASKLSSGTYTIVVRLFSRDTNGTKTILDTAQASGKVIVPGGYNGSFDLSDMSAIVDRNYSPVDGVVFTGFNINDEAGFEVAGVGDINADDFSDFMIFARKGQEYTAGNAGSAYLIQGQESFTSGVISLNSIPSPNAANRPVQGTLLLFPMENLATLQPGTNTTLGAFTAIGLPDVSNDNAGDVLIGCPDAAPLEITFANHTDSEVTITDQYGQARSLPVGAGSSEPMHVPTQFHIQGPWGSTSTVDYYGLFGSVTDNPSLGPGIQTFHFLPGDTIHIDIITGPMTILTVEHFRAKRGATYLLTSQRLNSEEYQNSVYDLNKVGSPIEDGVSDAALPNNGLTTIGVKYTPERCEMITWMDTDAGNWGSCLSVIADMNGNSYPELLISVPNADVTDLADPAHVNPDYVPRAKAGLIKFIDSSVRHSSIATGNIGSISWMWGEWVYLMPFNGSSAGVDGQDYHVDILGAQPGSELRAASGLGRFDGVANFGGNYTNGDYDGDNTPDFIAGAPGENSNGGSIYVVYGRTIFGRRSASIDLADFNKAINVGTEPSIEVPGLGIKITDTTPSERLGEVVKPAGDFNGDGLADVMFATPNVNASGRAEAGRVFILFGQKNQIGDFTLEQVDSHLGTQLPALIFEGQNPFDHLGTRICGVYDVNGDEIVDILLAAPDVDAPGKTDCGKIYLIYGKKNIIKTDPATRFKFVDYDNDGQPDEYWNIQSIGTTLPGAVFIGEADNTHLQALAPAGDVNGDDIGDFIVGAPNTNVSTVQLNAGKAYLIFGRKYVLSN